ncbi:MAG: hypothetical protein HYX75_19965 [Acidobacteria bacterium]|nr:hypothetical protein [Acidobacteriota bacterium]
MPPQPSSHIVIGQITSATTFDPYLHDEESTYSTLAHFYNKLVAFGPDLDVQPELAVRWENVTETVWRFYLRPGVVFHDGRPFGSPDVVSSIRRAKEMPNSTMGYYLQSIRTVHAVSDSTVEVVTNHASPVLLNKLAFVDIVPRDAGGSAIEHPVGTGPYRFVSGTPGGTVEAERFERYWGPRPAFDRVTILSLPGNRERALAVPSGKADLVARFPEEYWRWGQAQKDVRVLTRTGLAVTMLGFAHDKSSPFSDVRVRKAISLAIDSGRIAKHEPMGAGMDQIVPPGVFGYSKALTPFVHDPEEARRLLREADWPKGFETELLLPESLDSVGREIAVQLAQVGIRVHPSVVPWTDFSRQWWQGGNVLVLFSWAAGTGDASDVLDALVHSRHNGYGGFNYFGYSNPTVDHLIEMSNQTIDFQKRQKLLDEVMEEVHEDLPLLPIIQFFNLYAVRSGLDWTPRLDRRVRAFDLHPGNALLQDPAGHRNGSD